METCYGPIGHRDEKTAVPIMQFPLEQSYFMGGIFTRRTPRLVVVRREHKSCASQFKRLDTGVEN